MGDTSTRSSARDVRDPETLVVAVESTLTDARAGRWGSLGDLHIAMQVYEPLLRYDERLELKPALAESFEVEADRIDFRLRAGARFHDGTRCDAGTVVKSLRELTLWTAGLTTFIRDVHPVDAWTIRLELSRPCASLLDRLASPAAVIASPRALQCGSAPFQFTSKTNALVLERSRPNEMFRRVRFVPLPDGPTMWQALVAGEVDVVYETPYDVLRSVEQPAGIRVQQCSSLAVNVLMLHATLPHRVRRSICDALDAEALWRDSNQGVGEVAVGPIATASPFHRPLCPLSRAPIAAVSHELTLLCEEHHGQQWIQQMAGQFERAGIRVRILRLPFPILRERLQRGAFELALTGLPGSRDPDTMLYDVFHTGGRSNFTGLANEQLDALLDNARMTLDEGERSELYRTAAERLRETSVVVFLRHGRSIVASGSDIRNIRPHPLNVLHLHDAKRG